MEGQEDRVSVKRTRVEDIRVGDTVSIGDDERHIIGSRLRGDEIELLTTVGTLRVPRSTFLFIHRGTPEVRPEATHEAPADPPEGLGLDHAEASLRPASSPVAVPVFLAPTASA